MFIDLDHKCATWGPRPGALVGLTQIRQLGARTECPLWHLPDQNTYRWGVTPEN